MENTEVRWLTNEEQRGWRAMLIAHYRLVSVLDRELSTEHGLGLADYEVFVHLSEAPKRALRMTELADAVLLSPSGLTRRIDSLVKKGFVERVPCPSDGRGLLAVLTDAGFEKLTTMAPTHVRGVREHFIDRIDPERLIEVARMFEGLPVARIAAQPGPDCVPAAVGAATV